MENPVDATALLEAWALRLADYVERLDIAEVDTTTSRWRRFDHVVGWCEAWRAGGGEEDGH